MPKKTEIEKIFPRGFWGAFLALREGHPWTWLTGYPAIPMYPPFPRSVWRESFSHMPILPMPMPSGSARGWRPFWKEGKNKTGQGA